MDLTQGKIKTLFFKYLGAAFGSAMISSVYGIVDMAMAGQYQGPDGTAALAVVAPVWNLVYSLGLLTGIGGSVLLSTERGRRTGKENQVFTAALIYTAALSLICWIGIALFDQQLLLLFGAEKTVLPLARAYLFPVKFGVPLFLLNQMLSAFLRNDSNPQLTTAAVLAGGIFNMFGDYYFVFQADMGITGAGLATVLGAAVTFFVLLSHFFMKKCTLRLTAPASLPTVIRKISVIGFSTFFIDVAMGILTMLFNRQIIKFLGTDALAVYGVIVNVSTIVQCSAYSVGQAAQPIFSVNLGAGKKMRVRETLKYALYTVAVFSLAWTALSMSIPNRIVRIFMKPTAPVLSIAPGIIRSYAVSFLLLPLNIFSTYYFQALLKPRASFFVSVTRGMLLSGALIYALPYFVSPDAVWFAMPVTEFIVAAAVIILIRKYTKQDLTLPQME